ncbi:hypothetical protein [Rhizobium leguminosarum]|uniref:hypothetical protein n=1 Tax=Rhizobium leguminosarum TaxID=384 RepID=UPI0011AE238F|nr:hypothetical protein [Rhizobium leguminosarum]
MITGNPSVTEMDRHRTGILVKIYFCHVLQLWRREKYLSDEENLRGDQEYRQIERILVFHFS